MNNNPSRQESLIKAINKKGFNVQLVNIDKKNEEYNGYTMLKDVEGNELHCWKNYGSNGNFHNRENYIITLFDEVLNEDKLKKLADLGTTVFDQVTQWVPEWAE